MRLLIWITNAYMYLGLAKSLQNKIDCDLFAVSNADGHAKQYLENQDIVNFKKIWFPPDNIENQNKNPDTDYLEEFEKKYKIDLWKIVYGDRRLIKENQRYYKFSRKEHLQILEQSCKFFEKIIITSKPDWLILPATVGHNDHLLYSMCKTLGIKIIMLRTSRIGFKIALSENIEKLDEIDKNNQKYSQQKSFEEIREFFKKYSAIKQIEGFETKYKAPKLEKIKALMQFLLSNNSLNQEYINYGKTRIAILKQGLGSKHKIRKKRIKSFMEKNFLKEIKDEPFVYFPFHKEPERMLDIGAPYFTNQKSVAKMIAKTLPINFKLYVKDHPAQLKLTTGWKRSIEYYKELLELPNVELIHPSINTKEIVKKCSMVFTINGSSALEAAIYEKPAITLTYADFVELPSIILINNINEFRAAFEKVINQKVDQKSLSQYIDSLDKNSMEIDVYSIRKDFYNRFPYPGFLKWPEYSSEEVKKYLNHHEKIFDSLADEHIKKILKTS